MPARPETGRIRDAMAEHIPDQTAGQTSRQSPRQPTREGDMLGYARVSTTDQDLSGQVRRLQEAGAIRVFEDVISGKRLDRPGLAQLIDHARPGDSLCITRLDRLGRSLKELLEVVEDLRGRGIGLISLEERIDTTSAAGELVFHVFGAIAHFERRLIGERTRDGLAAARARGSRPGRPPVDSARLDAALRLVASGLTPSEAARQVGLGRSTLYRELSRRKASGDPDSSDPDNPAHPHNPATPAP